MNLSNQVKLARATALQQQIDAGATPGRMDLYTEPQPEPGATPTGEYLGSIVFPQPCGAIDTDTPGLRLIASPVQAVGAGMIAWARITDGDGNWCADGIVRQDDAPDADTADFLVDVAQVYPGGYVGLVDGLLLEG